MLTEGNFLLMKTIARILLVVTFLAATSGFAQRPGRQRGDLRMPDTSRVGDVAPDFKLKTKDGSREITLSSFKGKRPVVLVFGSYT